MNTKKEIIVLTGAGQLGMAIVRRMAYGNKLFIADWKMENAEAITKTLVDAGFEPLRVGGLDQSIRLEVFGDLHEFGALGKTVTLAEAKEKL